MLAVHAKFYNDFVSFVSYSSILSFFLLILGTLFVIVPKPHGAPTTAAHMQIDSLFSETPKCRVFVSDDLPSNFFGFGTLYLHFYNVFLNSEDGNVLWQGTLVFSPDTC